MTNLAVPNPATWETGEDVSAQLLNAQLRDSLNFLLNPPIYQSKNSVPVSLAAFSWTDIWFDQVVIDTYGGHNAGNTAQYIAQVAGYYQCSGVICYKNGGSDYWGSAAWAVNGTRVQGGASDMRCSLDVYTCITPPTKQVYLNVGDYVGIQGFVSNAMSTAQIADLDSSIDIRWVHH